MLKVITVVGTRPEIIRLACVIQLFDRYTKHILVHTGQNYDYELNQIFFEDLELRKPDYFLNVDTSSLGRVLGETLIGIEEVIDKEQPDAMLILGDTNASIAAIMAKRKHIPIYHMEAGNRSFDANVPEEINRKMIDHISDFNLVYTENSRRHLLAEGLSHRRVYLTGSPMFEVLQRYLPKIQKSDILEKLSLQARKYLLVSVHREENVDYPDNLRQISMVLNTLAEKYKYPIIVSTHPRTRKKIELLEEFVFNPLIQFLKPFGFSDYNYLQMNALCVVSDSGTISEESSILRFPAISIRNSMERPEAIDAGTIILTGFDPEVVLDSVNLAVEEGAQYASICPEYQVENTAMRVLKLVMGTAKLHKLWSGLY
ncbi:MAG: UDP-N-acetylglucosamine 2-epimerase (non-hydrolyzing) [Candidatus Cloacimonetes bacterium]|nr:UDP-N-acetylglucosamine 2-epimerase (non-hydrolyzing) [Candidatus Cloacimonadota bacterium]MDY0171701.1 UDP-N-acetylglucosamine 2-epimerase (non-hydrolyzing) [Candidatus Cloacimonadaceae bacterium]